MRHFPFLLNTPLWCFAWLCGFVLLTCPKAQSQVNIQWLEVENGQLNARRADSLFQKGRGRQAHQRLWANLAFTSSEFWVQIKVGPQAAANLYVGIGESHINRLNWYRRDSAHSFILDCATGDYLPFTSRPLTTADFWFPVQAGGHYLARVDKRHESLRLHVRAAPLNQLVRQEQVNASFNFFGLGAMVLMCVMMGYLFWRTSQRMYLWYIGYMIFGFGWIISNNGFGFQFFWPELPWFASRSRTVFMAGVLICSLQFLRHYLKGVETLWIRRSVQIISWACALGFLLPTLVVPYRWNGLVLWRWYVAGVTWVFILFLLFSVLWLVWALYRRSRPARFYAAAVLPLLVANYLNVFVYMGWVRELPVFWLQNSATLGFLAEVSLLTMGLIHQLDGYRRAKLAAEAALRQQQETNNELLWQTKAAERQQIADQLHDVAGSMISAARMNISAALDQLPSESVATKLSWAGTALASLSQTVRNLSHALSPGVVREKSIGQAMRNAAQLFSASGKLEVRVQASREAEDMVMQHGYLPLIYHAVYELLNNVARHSGADHAWLELNIAEDELVLVVADDGFGHPDKVASAGGTGLERLQLKTSERKGRLVIRSRKPQGLVVEWRLPLNSSRFRLGSVDNV